MHGAGDGNRTRTVSLGSSVLLLRKILLEVLSCKDFCVFRGAAECVLGRKNGRKSGLPEIRGGQWRLLYAIAETANRLSPGGRAGLPGGGQHDYLVRQRAHGVGAHVAVRDGSIADAELVHVSLQAEGGPGGRPLRSEVTAAGAASAGPDRRVWFRRLVVAGERGRRRHRGCR